MERSGKNAVTFDEWPHEEYPNFAAGLAYFLTRWGCMYLFNGISKEVEYKLIMPLVTECDGNDDKLWFLC